MAKGISLRLILNGTGVGFSVLYCRLLKQGWPWQIQGLDKFYHLPDTFQRDYVPGRESHKIAEQQGLVPQFLRIRRDLRPTSPVQWLSTLALMVEDQALLFWGEATLGDMALPLGLRLRTRPLSSPVGVTDKHWWEKVPGKIHIKRIQALVNRGPMGVITILLVWCT